MYLKCIKPLKQIIWAFLHYIMSFFNRIHQQHLIMYLTAVWKHMKRTSLCNCRSRPTASERLGSQRESICRCISHSSAPVDKHQIIWCWTPAGEEPDVLLLFCWYTDAFYTSPVGCESLRAAGVGRRVWISQSGKAHQITDDVMKRWDDLKCVLKSFVTFL